MVEWIGSQPLFIQVAAGILLAALALGLLGLFMISPLMFENFIGSFKSHPAPEPEFTATEDEVIKALMKYAKKDRQAIAAFYDGLSERERTAMAQDPSIRPLIEAARRAQM